MADESLATRSTRRLLSAYARMQLSLSRRFKRFAGHAVLSEPDANDRIAQAIAAGKPFMAGRVGFTELDAIRTVAGIRAQQSDSPSRRWLSQVRGEPAQMDAELADWLNRVSGFFPTTPPMVARLADVLVAAVSEADLLAIWYRRHEHRLMRTYAANALPMEPRGLEPYYHEQPWSLQLAGKRVLVVHPYETSIRAQFANRKRLFGDRQVWPECELKTLKAVQTLAGERVGFSDWFEALEHMQRDIDKIEFDVAIIGAGAYGLPLAAHVKRNGGIAIHIGGATQLLFGIRGRRWEDRPEVTQLYNEHWVRPAPEETPKAHDSVESGAYW